MDNEQNVIAFEEAKKPKKKNRGAPPPQTRLGFGESAEDKALVSKLLKEALAAYKQPRVKSDEELSERINNYFAKCAESGQIPTVEEMVMCTGYTYATWYDWETGRNHGFSPETSNIVKKAKEYLKTFDAKLVISGRLNFLAYCFRSKNYYDLRDKQEVVITPNSQNEQDMDADDIARRYIEDGRTVETTFTDSQE